MSDPRDSNIGGNLSSDPGIAHKSPVDISDKAEEVAYTEEEVIGEEAETEEVITIGSNKKLKRR
jgi:hypothetical protein